MRVAKPVVVVEGNSAKAIPILDKQFNNSSILLCILDGTLEAVDIKCSSVDSNDLSTDGHSLLVRRPFPQHVVEPALCRYDHAKGIGQVSYLPAGLGALEIIGWGFGINQSVTATSNTVKRCSWAMTTEPSAQKRFPIIGLNGVQRFHNILKQVCGRNETAIADSDKCLSEIVQRSSVAGLLANQRVHVEPHQLTLSNSPHCVPNFAREELGAWQRSDHWSYPEVPAIPGRRDGHKPLRWMPKHRGFVASLVGLHELLEQIPNTGSGLRRPTAGCRA